MLLQTNGLTSDIYVTQYSHGSIIDVVVGMIVLAMLGYIFLAFFCCMIIACRKSIALHSNEYS